MVANCKTKALGVTSVGLSGDLKIWKKVTDKVLKVTQFLDSLAYAVLKGVLIAD